MPILIFSPAAIQAGFEGKMTIRKKSEIQGLTNLAFMA
jgi:hypothetical protein